MEHVLKIVFQPLQPPRRCLAYRFLLAVGKGDLVKNPITLTTTQGLIIIAMVCLLMAGIIEIVGRPAPVWMVDTIKNILLVLIGVAVPHRTPEAKEEKVKA